MPDFYRAKLILGLYFIKIDNHTKARILLDEVVENSREFGESALKYIRAINVQADKKNRVKQEDREDKDRTSLSDKIKNTGRTVFLLTGILLGVIICLPFILSDKGTDAAGDTTYTGAVSSIQIEISEMSSILSGKDEEIKGLDEEIIRLKAVIDQTIQTTVPEETKTRETTDKPSFTETERLSDEFAEYLAIMRLYQDEKYLEAADRIRLFISMDTVRGSEHIDDIQKTYNTLMAAAARFCENGGVWYFEQGRYRDSLSLLERASHYLPGYTRMYRVNYYIGRCLFFLEEYELAKEKFQLVITQAPNDDWIMYANLRLDEINKLSLNEN